MAKKFLLRALCAVAFAGSAIAQTTDPKVVVDVVKIGSVVTVSGGSTNYGTPDNTYVAYTVKFNNGGGSELRKAKLMLTASASSTGLTQPQIQTRAGDNPDLPAKCTVASGGATATCDYSDEVWAPGYSFEFVVIVSAPKFVGDPVSGSMSLKVEGQFREGKSGSASDNSLGYTSDTDSHIVAQLAPDQVDSVVIKRGGSLFTGKGGIPSASDKQSTTVKFDPLTINYDLVNITEAAVTGARANTCAGDRYFRTCFETSLSAPGINYGTTGYLTETIRAHSSNVLKPASQMSQLIWYYTPTGGTDADVKAIGQCASPTTPNGGPLAGTPCQVGPGVCYTNKNAPSPDRVGECFWNFININNGLIRPML